MLSRRHEHVDIDGAGAFQAHRLDLVVLEHDILVFAALIALDLVILVHRLAADGVDILAQHAVAGFPVEGVKADLLIVGGRRHHRHRAGHEGKLQIAFPE